MFQLRFDEPLAVSMGLRKDQMVLTVVNGEYFSGTENGLPIEPGTELGLPLPKQYANEDLVMFMETAKGTVETAANTLIVGQIIVTLVLAASLKSMWNLMNVIQVLAYVRFFAGWPALTTEVFEYMDNAITMKPVTDVASEYGKSEFEKANATLTDEGMLDIGVQDSSILKSFGAFGVAALVLLLLLVLYRMVTCLKRKTGLAHKLRLALEKKLFYSSFLRYLIVSNLKLNYTIWAFLLAKGGFESVSGGAQTIV